MPCPAHRAACALTLAAPLLALSACSTLATSPSWIGGGLAVSAPARAAEEDASFDRERAIVASQPHEIGAKHILIMHSQSKARPDAVTRSREEARQLAQKVLLEIRGGASFEQMITRYSDEPGAAERGGDLGVFERTLMVKPFSDAAFALKVNEVSEVVETQYGFHIIKRTE